MEIKKRTWSRIVGVGIIRNVFKKHGRIVICPVDSVLDHWDTRTMIRLRMTGWLAFPPVANGARVTK